MTENKKSEKKRICPYPFSRSVTGKKGFVPCCSDWLSPEIYPAAKFQADTWNSAEAQELRRRILNGDYSLCRRDRCRQPLSTIDELTLDPNVCPDAPLDSEALKAIEHGEVNLKYGPLAVSVAADSRCNLKCPSCRPDYIHHLNDFDRLAVAATEFTLLGSAENLKIVRLAGNGEVFFSPWLRTLLKSFNRQDYPRIDHLAILSNGLLFDAKQLEDLRPGSDLIRKVYISVDAGDEKSYEAVRGGDWKRLIQNLEWMAEQRRAGRFDTLVFHLIVQKKNYASIPALVALGKRLKIDLINLYEIYDWSTGMNHKEAAVHDPSHPEHHELMRVLDPFRNDPIVRMSASLSKEDGSQPTVKSFFSPE